MNKKYFTLISILLSLSVSAEVVLQDDFNSGQGSWATRAPGGDDPSTVVFDGTKLDITLSATNSQPGAAYHSFNTLSLADGETLRVTVEAATANTAPRPRDLRIALGFASTEITGDTGLLAVPLSGYMCTIPSAGDPTNPRIVWVDSSGGDSNFFNSSTTNLGDPPLDDSVYADTSLRTWVFEITRSGSELYLSGSFDGTNFATAVTAVGTDVIPNFEFNTIGLAYAFAAGETGTYDNLTVERTSVVAPIPFSDDFSAGQGNWATRSGLTGSVNFDGDVTIVPNGNGQPSAAYHAFEKVTLNDGETLRVSVDASTDYTTPRPRDLRIALGFANPVVVGDTDVLAVGLSGYYCTVPSAGDPNNPRMVWVDSSGGDLNFFNSGTTTLGNPPLDDSVSVGTTLKNWVFEITRSGSDLYLTGSLDGTAFTDTIVATGLDVIPNYEFNTIGLAYSFSAGQSATYDNLTVEKTTVVADLPFNDDFGSGQQDWATRSLAATTVDFSGGDLDIILTTNAQPGAAYHAFNTASLADGDTLRLTVDVSTTSGIARSRDFRVGLGFADPVITGDLSSTGVPLSGYFVTAPSNGDTTDSRVTWIDNAGVEQNFFNTATTLVGDLALSDSVFVDGTPKTWIIEITRSGADLVFSGSLDGTAYSSTATANLGSGNLIPDYKFNTVGLAYAFDLNQTATFDNLTVEWIQGGISIVVPVGVEIAIVGNDVELTFDTVNGLNYQLEASTDDLTTFAPVGSPQTGDGNPLTLIDSGAKPASGNSIFYRIDVSN